MRRYLAGGLALLLAGCGSLLEPSNPPLQIYLLRPQLEALPDAPKVSWQLAIARPEMARTMDTERIALTRAATMDYYADAQWSDAASRLLQQLLIESFEKSGRILGVGQDAGEVRTDYMLQTEVRDFEAHYDSENGPPQVVVALSAKLIEARSRDVIGSFTTSHSIAASQNSVPAVVDAFNAATAAVLEDVASWTLRAPSEAGPSGFAPKKGR
jgi:cholesterol transport system auxiliary component